MSIRRMFNTTADLYTSTATRTRLGGVTHAFAVSTSSMPCRISTVPPREREVGDTAFAEADGVIYCPSTVTVSRGDEIRTASVTYEVLGVRTPSRRGAHHEAIVRSEQRGD